MRPKAAAIRTKSNAATPASGRGESLVSQATVVKAIRQNPTVIATKKVLLNLMLDFRMVRGAIGIYAPGASCGRKSN
jgi:hypothetical protein